MPVTRRSPRGAAKRPAETEAEPETLRCRAQEIYYLECGSYRRLTREPCGQTAEKTSLSLLKGDAQAVKKAGAL